MIYSSFDLRSKEYFDLSNLVEQVVKFNQISDKDGCHQVSSCLIEINNSSYPHTMHDLVQSSKCDFTILESSGTYQGVEALQLPLMVMSTSRDSG